MMGERAGEGSDPGPAELFERFFGPAIFVPWTQVLLEHAEPRPSEQVLDLGCGTGTVARQVALRLQDEGTVVGLDNDPDMLRVARQRASSENVTVEWIEADAMDIELPDDAFDLVLCQQGLQFFPEPLRALREAARVLRTGGRIALNVWKPLAHHPVYEALFEAEARHLDADLDTVATPFTFGDTDRLSSLMDDAGFEDVQITERTLNVEFSDPDTFVTLTVMAGAAVLPELAVEDEDERSALIEAVSRDSADVLEQYRDGDHLAFPMPNQIATGFA
jgi:ubiquinone/menaquinone biosynthesis C-methylase UbiE